LEIKIKEIAEGFTPVYMHVTDACADCMANVDNVIIPQGDTVFVPLGFAVEIPAGYEGIIKGRSGLSASGLICALGTIDTGYTGEVKAILTNLSDDAWKINRGDRICQFKVQKSEKINFVKVNQLAESERGENGIGSTGIK